MLLCFGPSPVFSTRTSPSEAAGQDTESLWCSAPAWTSGWTSFCIWGQTLCMHLKRSQKRCALGIPLFLSSVAAWDVSSPKKWGHIKDCHISPTSSCKTNKEPSDTLLLFLVEGTQTESEVDVCQPVSRLPVGTPAAGQPGHMQDFSYVLYLPKVRLSLPWAAQWTKDSFTLLTHSYVLRCVGK